LPCLYTRGWIHRTYPSSPLPSELDYRSSSSSPLFSKLYFVICLDPHCFRIRSGGEKRARGGSRRLTHSNKPNLTSPTPRSSSPLLPFFFLGVIYIFIISIWLLYLMCGSRLKPLIICQAAWHAPRTEQRCALHAS